MHVFPFSFNPFRCILLSDILGFNQSMVHTHLVNRHNFSLLPPVKKFIIGNSANAVPHYQKLECRVSNICGNRRGQPNPKCNGSASPWGYHLFDHGKPLIRHYTHIEVLNLIETWETWKILSFNEFKLSVDVN